jgi:pimeloyl-ACP methyl ester carboxylesterase
MTFYRPTLPWVTGYLKREPGRIDNTYTADYSLVDLIRKGLVDAEDADRMLGESGLEDFFWQLTWPEDYETPDEYLSDRIINVQGYCIFVHGWTGNHKIWEDLPGLTVMANRRLVAISVDHNGFGKSVFREHSPALEACNPPAAMKVLEDWVDVLKIRRQPGQPQRKVLNFIGHSMGGATLFYMDPMKWAFGETTRYALAPALLLEDDQHRRFYTALGTGIGILQRIPALEFVERLVKPTVVNRLTAGSSVYVKEVHTAQYNDTPRGITGATFVAMGRLQNTEIAHNWDLFRVMLGHRDPLVGLTAMMDLLGKLEVPAGNVRVVPGTHYMFSIGNETPTNAYQHAQNRELVVQDILGLNERAYKMQTQGQLVGGDKGA